MRISDMFVRRYFRPPRGSSAEADSRWRLSQHKDASELSVSVELSDPAAFTGATVASAACLCAQGPTPVHTKHSARLQLSTACTHACLPVCLSLAGGLYLGKRLGYSPSAGWRKAETLPSVAQGSAVIHRGNLTHGVSVKSGERWSLIIFFFPTCQSQVQTPSSA